MKGPYLKKRIVLISGPNSIKKISRINFTHRWFGVFSTTQLEGIKRLFNV